VSHRFIDAADNHIVSLDGTYLYYTTIGVEMEPQVKRFRFADHQIETITSEGDLRLRGYIGVAPDGSRFYRATSARRKSYALNVRWP
jgi:hypothetical protein